MKYVVFKTPIDEEHLICAPCTFVHTEIVRMADNYNRAILKPISAGFVKLDAEGRPYCCGHSTTLNLNSRPEDIKLLKSQFRLANIF